MYSKLKGYGKFTGMCWLLSPESETQGSELPIPTIEELIYSEEFLGMTGAKEQREFIIGKVQVSSEDITKVNRLTLGQRNNPLWHLIRRGRLTASNFGCILNAKRVTPSLIKRLQGEYDISRVKAVIWGVNNEIEGLNAFKSMTGLPVEEAGFILHESGILGATPDGLVV